MKKLFLIAFVAGFIAPAFAQETAVLSAWEYLETYRREKQAGNEAASVQALLDAKKEIDGAVLNANTSQKSKTWKRRGDVYFEIGTNPSPQLVLYKAGAIDTAAANYLKALVVEVKSNGKPVIEDKNDILYTKLPSIGNTFLVDAGKLSEKKEYDKAIDLYLKARNIYDQVAANIEKNSSFKDASKAAMVNVTLSYVNKGDDDNTIKYATELLSLGYDSAWVYQTLSYAYIKKEDKTKAAEILSKGKEKYPNNAEIFLADLRLALDNGETERAKNLIEEGKSKFPGKKADIILEEVNFYLSANNDEQAVRSLEEAIAIYKDKSDKGDVEIKKLLYFNAGIIYDNLATKTQDKDKTKAKEYREKGQEYYGKTLEVDPNYVSAYNQIANYHVKLGNDFVEEANLLPLEKTKEYDALKVKADGEYKKAIEILEKGYAIQKDETLKKNLIALYKKTQQVDKLKSLEGQ